MMPARAYFLFAATVESTHFRRIQEPDFGHTREPAEALRHRRPVRYSHMTGKKAVPHEGAKEQVIDEHPVPSGYMGRVRGTAVGVYRSSRAF
jgi:hypothetical protein